MKIAVLNTGGTISCYGAPLHPMTAAEFAAACIQILNPILAQQFPKLAIDYVTDLTFPESSSGTLDSTNLQPSDWCIMASYILEHYDQYDGWVLLHGTDSMDFTGTALPFLLTSFDARGVATGALSKPVIITGSQVPMFYQAPGSTTLELNYNTDAYQNFCGAVAAAQSGIPEVCVYFQNHLYRGNRVVKTNASEFDAFSSPNYPALGEYGVSVTIDQSNILPPPVGDAVSLDTAAVLSAVNAQLQAVTIGISGVQVMQFPAFPAWYSFTGSKPGSLLANLINACVAQGVRGIVLESYGEGNFPSGNPDNPSGGATYQALDAANRSGVVLVDATQVTSGVVNDSAYAAGAWLPAVGALNPADMTPMAAFAKLTVLLAAAPHNGWSADDVKRLLQTNLLGEMISVNRLDSRQNAELLAGQSISALDGSATLLNDPAQGPVLKSSSGTVLWSPLGAPSAELMPGRLVMQNDGNLVFFSRNNRPMWATNTGISRGASSLLILGGSEADGTLSLQVYNYSDNVVSAILYPSTRTKEPTMNQVKRRRATSNMPRHFKLSGRIAPDDRLHQPTVGAPGEAPDEHYIAPATVSVVITDPQPTHTIGVPQYADTVRSVAARYDPAGDCSGYFMSCRFQANNNCYAYGCNIATNTFPQPGRASGCLIQTIDGPTVSSFAVKDGLVFVGETLDDVRSFATKRRQGRASGALDGHFVALMISPAGDSNWPGDYHWARCDDNETFTSWSQKDGGDQVTNFDFAGQPLTDPASANWTVNQGPVNDSPPDPVHQGQDQLVSYAFYCYMFVPDSGVNIL